MAFTADSKNLVMCHFVKKKLGGSRQTPLRCSMQQHSRWLCILSVLHMSAALTTSMKYVAAQIGPTCKVVECAQACMTGIVGHQCFNFSGSVQPFIYIPDTAACVHDLSNFEKACSRHRWALLQDIAPCGKP